MSESEHQSQSPIDDESSEGSLDLSMEAIHDKETSSEQIQQIANVLSAQFVGPIPPPNIIERYERILPGSADRIISMAEKEQNFEHKMREKMVDAQISDRDRYREERKSGQKNAFRIGVVGIVGAVFLGVFGNPWASGVLSGGTVAALVGSFLYDKNLENIRRSKQTKLDVDQPSS